MTVLGFQQWQQKGSDPMLANGATICLEHLVADDFLA
jgi:hypothetical protein